MSSKLQKRQKRKMHIRKSLSGTTQRPRLTVYRSNQHIYAQVVDDETGVTIVSANDFDIKKGSGVEKATEVGAKIGKAAKAKKVDKVVFDRNGYKFHGRVKALADAARESGLEF